MSTLHLIGFEDWLKVEKEGPFLPNPGRLLAEQARRDPQPWLEASGHDTLSTVLLPVPASGVLDRDFEAFKARAMQAIAPVKEKDTVLAVGQGPLIQAPLRLETRALNRLDGVEGRHIQVVEGDQLVLTYPPNFKQAFTSCLKPAISSGELELSENAGTYYCNAMLFLLECLPGRWFGHVPAFLVGYEQEARAYWGRFEDVFSKRYPGKGPQDISFGSTAEQVRLLQAFLLAVRGARA